MMRYGFIGTGSMGSMLIKQFILAGAVAPQVVSASSRTGSSTRTIAAETGIAVKGSNREVARDADVLFVCVRPPDVRGVLEEIRDLLSADKLLVSIAACVTLQDLETWAGPGVRCVKVIPSVTAEKRSGISLVAWGSGVTPADRELVFSLFSAVGSPVEIDERNFELYSDLTSCAPALFAATLQEYASAAVRKGGIHKELAEYLVLQTMIGTAQVLDSDGATFDDLIRRVATEGGITGDGVSVLRNRLPAVYDELLDVTLAKHSLIKQMVAGQDRER